jgi:hypothetical protein
MRLDKKKEDALDAEPVEDSDDEKKGSSIGGFVWLKSV